jgi:hypothetical protein
MPLYLKLLRKIIDTGIIPEIWAIGIISGIIIHIVYISGMIIPIVHISGMIIPIVYISG